MLRFFSIFFFLLLISNANSQNKDKIIDNLKNTANIHFKFEQIINGKIENGECTIKYPKKIFCKYNGNINKILVSNGNSLVIKTKTSYYRYPLDKTPLNLILDKNYLIKKINSLNEVINDQNFINFKIIDKDNEINIFFDSNTYDFVGWQNKDIYQNVNITFLSSIKRNTILKKNLFKLPTQN